MLLPGCWTAHMRVFTLALAFCAIASPCPAQSVLKSEPLMLAPYEVAFVQNATCPVGQVPNAQRSEAIGVFGLPSSVSRTVNVA